MSEFRQVGQEIWLCEPVQCEFPPLIHFLLRENPTLFLALLHEDGDGGLVIEPLPPSTEALVSKNRLS